MEGAPLSLVLDIVILVLLGLTIVYAARLSLQLRRLRDSKSDLDKVVRDLIKNLDRADKAIAGLRETARDSGAELQNNIDRAMALSDELQLITESGDRLAGKLDMLVDGARAAVSNGGGHNGAAGQAASKMASPLKAAASAAPADTYAKQLRKLDAPEERVAVPVGAAMGAAKGGFAIRDPEVERGLDPVAEKLVLEDDGTGQALYSEAERDLFRAIKNRGAR